MYVKFIYFLLTLVSLLWRWRRRAHLLRESSRCSLVGVLVLSCQITCLFLCVGGVEMQIFLSFQPQPHLLPSLLRCMSSHLFCFHTFSTLRWNSAPVPTLRHIRSNCALRGKAQCILTNSIGGVITSQWSGMRGQEWGIETSFRLRIMDHLPNKFPSLWVVLFLTWGTHTYVENFAYIHHMFCEPIARIHRKTPLRNHQFIQTRSN